MEREYNQDNIDNDIIIEEAYNENEVVIEEEDNENSIKSDETFNSYIDSSENESSASDSENIARLDPNLNSEDFLNSFISKYSFISNFDIHEESIKAMRNNNKKRSRLNNENFSKTTTTSQSLKEVSKIQREWSKFANYNGITSDLSYKINNFIEQQFGTSLIDSDINRNDDKDYRYFTTLTYDTCTMGCCVYVGDNKNKIRCPKCQLPRYYDCPKPRCKLKPYNKMCLTHPDLRETRSCINYRSIERLIFELIQQESFIEAINYIDINNHNCDGLNETVLTKNMDEMHRNFQTFLNTYHPQQNQGVDISQVVEINLCISCLVF